MEPYVHYHSNKCPPPVPIFSQLDLVHTHTSHFLKIHFNIILPSTTGSTKWSLTLRFPHQNPVYASPLSHARYMPRPSHSSRFYHPNNIVCGVQIVKLLIMTVIYAFRGYFMFQLLVFCKFHMGVIKWKWILMFYQFQLITNTKTLLHSCTELM